MPVLSQTYKPPLLFRSGHLSTIHAGLVRTVPVITAIRERIDTYDGDFLDLDWFHQQKKRPKGIALVIHGLEGSALRPYVQGMAHSLANLGLDICAINLRGCSGEPNRLYSSYHSGITEDVNMVIQHLEKAAYQEVFLVGFSLGGNLVLKYLGEERARSKIVKAAAAISVPCDLYDSMRALHRWENKLYFWRFRSHLVNKLWIKHSLFPKHITSDAILSIRNLKDFDDVYTAPAHGFKDALDYYSQCSSKQYLSNITTPTLLINSLNDSFLGPNCYPRKEAEDNPYLHLELTRYGGHVGFQQNSPTYYSEMRVHYFFKEVNS